MSALTVEQAPAPARVRRRADAYAARRVLWRVSQLDRVRSCGHHSVRQSGQVTMRLSGDKAGYAGLASCGSVWACPVCSRKIAAQRQSDIALAVERWAARGGSVALATFTMRHRRGQRLATLWGALSHAWGRMASGRAWRAEQGWYGVEGWLRVVEVTVGRNGWHVHVHALLFLHSPLEVDRLRELEASMYGRWAAALKAKGVTSLRSVGADFRMVDARTASTVGDYFAKQTYTAAQVAGLEVARADLKSSRRGGRTPFQVLREFLTNGDADDLAVWHEFERASKGRRQLLWSRGFRETLRLTRERTDDEIAAEETGTALDDVLTLPAETFAALRPYADYLLEVLEAKGKPAVIALLDHNGLSWTDPLRT